MRITLSFLWFLGIPIYGGIHYYYAQGLSYKDDIVEEFTIQSESDFKYFYQSYAKNDIYNLDRDITITSDEFLMIGTQKYPFNGIFNGNGYSITISNHTTIKGNKDHQALFGVNKGVIKNLVIKQSTVTLEGINSAILVAENFGEVESIVIHQTTLKLSSLVRFGGLVIGSNHGTLKKAYVSGEITKETNFTNRAYVGGLVGFDWNEDQVSMTMLLTDVLLSDYPETSVAYQTINRNVGAFVGSMKDYDRITSIYMLSTAQAFYSEQTYMNLVKVDTLDTEDLSDLYTNTLSWMPWMITYVLAIGGQ